MTASQNTHWELTLTSTKTYANPFLDVTVTVEYTKAGASPLPAMASGMGARPLNCARPSRAGHLALQNHGDRPV